MTASRETEPALSPQPKERKERRIDRTGVVLVLATRDPETQKASVFVVQHNANSRKGIRDNDLGLPCETIESDELLTHTVERLLVEEIGISPNSIKAFIQPGHDHLELKLPEQGVRADIVVLWLTDTTQLSNASPKDTGEIKGGFFLPIDVLYPNSKFPLRQDLNPGLFLGPLINRDFLSPNGGYHPANLDNTAPPHTQI